MAIFTPCFLIMNTSVVPEGERQPFLLLLALSAIAEVVLARDKRQPLHSGEDLPSSCKAQYHLLQLHWRVA